MIYHTVRVDKTFPSNSLLTSYPGEVSKFE